MYFFERLKNATYNEATWMETLNYVSRRPYLPTTFYRFWFGSLSHEKSGLKVEVLFFQKEKYSLGTSKVGIFVEIFSMFITKTGWFMFVYILLYKCTAKIWFSCHWLFRRKASKCGDYIIDRCVNVKSHQYAMVSNLLK